MNGISDISESEAVLIDYWYERFEPDLGLHSNFLHNELWEIDYDAYVQGTLYSEKSFRNPSTNESETCYLIGEEKSQKKENGKINFQRVYTSQFSDIVHGGSTAFTPKNWDGLFSTHANGGKVYGVSFDSKKYSFFTGRKEIESIGEIEDKTSTEGATLNPEPQGVLTVSFADETKDFSVDLSILASEVQTSANSQSALGQINVYKSSTNIAFVADGIEDFESLTVEDTNSGVGYNYEASTGLLKISFAQSSSVPTGVLLLSGGSKTCYPQLPAKGSFSVNYNSPYDVNNFTIPDLTQSEETIDSWIQNNTKFQLASVTKTENEDTGEGVKSTVKITTNSGETPNKNLLSGVGLAMTFDDGSNTESFIIPDLGASDEDIEAWILANTNLTKPNGGGFWTVPASNNRNRHTFQFQHPTISYVTTHLTSFALVGGSDYAIEELWSDNAQVSLGVYHATSVPDSILDEVSSIVLNNGAYDNVIPTAEYVTSGAVGFYITWEILGAGAAAVTLPFDVLEIDISKPISSIQSYLTARNAVSPTATKEDDAASVGWTAGTLSWIIGDEAPASYGAANPSEYLSIELLGLAGKTANVIRTGEQVDISYTPLDAGTTTTYSAEPSLRRFGVNNHGLVVGALVAFWKNDNLVARTTVSKVIDDNFFEVPLKDVDGVDFVATHISDLLTKGDVDSGSKVVPSEITKSFFIPTITSGISTFFDIPTIQGGDTAQAQLDALVADHVTKIPIGPSELKQLAAGLYMREVTQVKLDDVMRSGWVAPDLPTGGASELQDDYAGPLDFYSDFDFCYSPKLLNSNYSGPLLSVMREDGQLKDVFPVYNGIVSINSISDWANGQVWVVNKLYNQNGNGFVEQVDFAKCIQLSTAINGKPCFYFPGDSYLTGSINSWDGETAITWAAVEAPHPETIEGNSLIFIQWSGDWGGLILKPTTTEIHGYIAADNTDAHHYTRANSDGTLESVIMSMNGSTFDLYRNGIRVANKVRNTPVSRTSTPELVVGAGIKWPEYSKLPWRGHCFALVGYRRSMISDIENFNSALMSASN